MNLPVARIASSIGSPELGRKKKLTSPSSSPRLTETTPGMPASAATATSAMKALRGITTSTLRLRKLKVHLLKKTPNGILELHRSNPMPWKMGRKDRQVARPKVCSKVPQTLASVECAALRDKVEFWFESIK